MGGVSEFGDGVGGNGGKGLGCCDGGEGWRRWCRLDACMTQISGGCSLSLTGFGWERYSYSIQGCHHNEEETHQDILVVDLEKDRHTDTSC